MGWAVGLPGAWLGRDGGGVGLGLGYIEGDRVGKWGVVRIQLRNCRCVRAATDSTPKNVGIRIRTRGGGESIL